MYLRLQEDPDMAIFSIFDRDGDGIISQQDFFNAVELLGREGGAEGEDYLGDEATAHEKRKEWAMMWKDMDTNNSGYVEPNEFIQALRNSRKEEDPEHIHTWP